MHLRHQLAAYSPITPGDVVAAASELVRQTDAAALLTDSLRSRYSADEVWLLDSGTHALQAALILARTPAPAAAPVAMPAFACYDIATAAVAVSARVLLYDVDPETLAPDPASFERVLRAGARVAVIAPLYGIPVDWEIYASLARQNETLLIEDAAQGHGASWKGMPLGSLGDISILSFSRGKGWTGGQGGAVLLRGRAAGNVVPPRTDGGSAGELRNLLQLAAQWLLGRPSIYGIPRALPWLGLGETRYRAPSAIAPLPRTAARSLVRSAAWALREATGRQERARRMLDALRSAEARPIVVLEGGVAGYLRLPIRVRGGLPRFHSIGLATRLGIAASYPRTLAQLQPMQALLLERSTRYPGADSLASDLITLPTHSRVSQADVDAILALTSPRGAAGSPGSSST